MFLKTKSKWRTVFKRKALCILEYTQNIPRGLYKWLYFGSRRPRIGDEGVGGNWYLPFNLFYYMLHGILLCAYIIHIREMHWHQNKIWIQRPALDKGLEETKQTKNSRPPPKKSMQGQVIILVLWSLMAE